MAVTGGALALAGALLWPIALWGDLVSAPPECDEGPPGRPDGPSW